MLATEPPTRTAAFPMGMREFVIFIAALMSLTALAIDAMLPALGQISQDYALSDPNDRQWVVAIFLFGFGVGSLFFGPLCDRFGRRAVLLPALLGYSAAALAGAFATSFEQVVLLRLAAGICAGGGRVVVLAIVRDRFEGDAMARVMSLAFIFFTMAPLFAPFIGFAILQFAEWHWIFVFLAVCGIAMLVWSSTRLKETLAQSNAIPIQPRRLLSTWRLIIFNRTGAGYVMAAGLTMSPLFGFITSSQQVFATTFNWPEIFPFMFALISACLATSAFVNARFVERFGARPIAHSAMAGTLILGLVMTIGQLTMGESLPRFAILLAGCLGMTGFVNSNCSSIAMQPFGAMAGSASSFQGFLSTMVSAGLGALIGQMFDGTTFPLSLGFVLCAAGALLCVAWAEKGRLFERKTLSNVGVGGS